MSSCRVPLATQLSYSAMHETRVRSERVDGGTRKFEIGNMEQHNPWLTIWTQPRSTISRIVAHNPNQCLWWLAAIYGFCSLMNLFQSMALGSAMGPVAIVIWAVVLAPFWGWLNFSIWSVFVSWVGKWFKGEGSFTTVRSAYAWSCVPIVLNVPLWLLMVVLFGQQLFLNFPDAHLLPNYQMTFLFLILIIKVVLAVWSLVIYLNALAEVQKFSILKAILNVVLAGVIFAVIMFVVWSLLIYALGSVPASACILLNPF